MGAAKKIRMCLTDKDMSIAELAEKSGAIRQTFYNKLQRDKMDFETVERLADLLGCDVVLKDRQTGKEYN